MEKMRFVSGEYRIRHTANGGVVLEIPPPLNSYSMAENDSLAFTHPYEMLSWLLEAYAEKAKLAGG